MYTKAYSCKKHLITAVFTLKIKVTQTVRKYLSKLFKNSVLKKPSCSIKRKIKGAR